MKQIFVTSTHTQSSIIVWTREIGLYPLLREATQSNYCDPSCSMWCMSFLPWCGALWSRPTRLAPWWAPGHYMVTTSRLGPAPGHAGGATYTMLPWASLKCIRSRMWQSCNASPGTLIISSSLILSSISSHWFPDHESHTSYHFVRSTITAAAMAASSSVSASLCRCYFYRWVVWVLWVSAARLGDWVGGSWAVPSPASAVQPPLTRQLSFCADPVTALQPTITSALPSWTQALRWTLSSCVFYYLK